MRGVKIALFLIAWAAFSGFWMGRATGPLTVDELVAHDDPNRSAGFVARDECESFCDGADAEVLTITGDRWDYECVCYVESVDPE